MAKTTARRTTPKAVFRIFLWLGLTSFGGPIAHLGYFREEFVVKRRWFGDDAYADLVALCQFLPGPASSQVGFAIGLRQAGLRGALAAWAGFTMPSVILMLAAAWWIAVVDNPIAQGVIQGLKLVAVAIVAQAVWGMARTLAPDKARGAIAMAAVVAVVFIGGAAGQVGAILLGAFAGLILSDRILDDNAAAADAGHASFVWFASAAISLAIALALLAYLPWAHALDPGNHALALFDAFYRAGALVFGGGHVVLPLLDEAVVKTGWVAPADFLAGYGVAQALPGPLFTFAAYLGAIGEPSPSGVIGAAIALVAIFLPGLLLVAGVMPFWAHIRHRDRVRAAVAGVNAAVVGLLAAALYDPVWTAGIRSPQDFAVVAVCFLLLTVWRAPSLSVVTICALWGALPELM